MVSKQKILIVDDDEHIAELMAEMSVTDENSLKEKVQTNGYITVMDPACGSGRISFSLCKSIK